MKYSYNQYMKDVIEGKITSNSSIKKAINRGLGNREREDDPDFPYIFLESEAQKIIDFVRFTGIINPLPFQQWIYAELYGWRHKKDHSIRRFTEAFVSMAKKNGKTLFISPLLLYDLYFTHQPESYVISTNVEVSKRSFENIRSVIDQVPEFSKTIRITRSEMTNPNNRGTMKFFSSDKNKNGLGASLLVADEAAFFDDYILFDRLRTGMKARRNKLTITISTNGENKNLPYYEEYEKNKKILDGIYEDDQLFIALYEFDEGDDLYDQGNWIKPNPALDNKGLDIPDKLSYESIDHDLKNAEMVPSKKQRILLYNFNMWSESSKTWISNDRWKPNIRKNPKDDILKGLRCYGGLDISEVSDLTSFTLYFEPVNGLIPVIHKAYISQASLKDKELHESSQYKNWIEKGWVTICEGNTIDHQHVIRDILELTGFYQVMEIGVDPNYRTQEYVRVLEEENGLNLVEVRQGMAHFSPFTKAWERDVLEGRVCDENPVMEYCLSNCEIRPDINNNYKPFKKDGKYKNKIDLVITSIMAHSRLKANQSKKKKRKYSIYDILD